MFIYRKIAEKDYNDILEICRHVWEGTDYLPKVFYKWLKEAGLFIGVVDTTKNQVVGTGRLSILTDGSGWLEGLRIHEDYRGKKLARGLTEKLLEVAMEMLKKREINKIAFSTHISCSESITLMKKFNFVQVKAYHLISKDFEKLDPKLGLEDYRVEPWALSFEGFKHLPYFQEEEPLLPLAFVFQEPTRELYEELKEEGSFISINGYRGIYRLKGDQFFLCIDNCRESIKTYLDYFLLKGKDEKLPPPLTIVSANEDLISKLKEDHASHWSDWQPDCLYFVYK